jgi:60 kDa SS-A/Ro ribonucleoprotein
VAEIVRVSDAGRAPRNDPALFGLAMASGLGDAETRRAALDALPRVARTATHLFRFATYVDDFRGWGRSLRRAVGCWYAAQPVEALAHQAVKHRRREGVAHRDLLRRAHPARRVSAGNPTLAVTPGHERLFDWIVRGGTCDGLPRIVEGFVRAQASASPDETARLVAEYRLPREAVRPDHLGCAAVWAALLDDMPIAALVRNLATMTRVGVLAPGSAGTATVVARLGDADRIRRARLHPVALLAALRTYAAGRGVRGPRRWEPVAEVVDALDAAFVAAFEHVEPTGRRLLLASTCRRRWRGATSRAFRG